MSFASAICSIARWLTAGWFENPHLHRPRNAPPRLDCRADRQRDLPEPDPLYGAVAEVQGAFRVKTQSPGIDGGEEWRRVEVARQMPIWRKLHLACELGELDKAVPDVRLKLEMPDATPAERVDCNQDAMAGLQRFVRRHSVELVRIFLNAIEPLLHPRCGSVHDDDRFHRRANVCQRHPARGRQIVSGLDRITGRWLR